MIGVAVLIAATTGRYELVARWPDAPQSNYTRVYATKSGCERAAAAIEDAHDRRVARVEERDRASRIMQITSPPPEPFVACVPR